MNYRGYDLDTIDPSRRPDDATPEEWRAYLAHLFDWLGTVLTRPDLPSPTAEHMTALRALIADTLI
ncbi:hypothetical protein [Streptomyces sp. LN500]|uniref:hypothetical protein n=1 Tax=Streptomyces sp. LN500 TaxID=3112978 RepID=UPI0037240E8D